MMNGPGLETQPLWGDHCWSVERRTSDTESRPLSVNCVFCLPRSHLCGRGPFFPLPLEGPSPSFTFRGAHVNVTRRLFLHSHTQVPSLQVRLPSRSRPRDSSLVGPQTVWSSDRSCRTDLIPLRRPSCGPLTRPCPSTLVDQTGSSTTTSGVDTGRLTCHTEYGRRRKDVRDSRKRLTSSFESQAFPDRFSRPLLPRIE